MYGITSVRRDGGSPLWRLGALSAQGIRLPLYWPADIEPYLENVKDGGGQVVLVLDRDSFEDWNDWRNSADQTFDRVEQMLDKKLVDALVVGNEWDDGWQGPGMDDDPRIAPRGGVSSWVMPFDEIGQMVAWAAARLAGRVPLILGGMSSGQPAAIDSLDLSKVSALSIHPYGKRPARDWPSPDWGFGFVGDWLDALASKLAERGLTGRVRLTVGELGVNKYETGTGLMAEWFARMLSYLNSRGDVDFSSVFCDGDDNVDGYGQFKIGDRPEPSVAVIQAAFAAYATQNQGQPLLKLEVAEPVPEPVPEPEEPEPTEPEPGWWDEQFTAEEIVWAFAQVNPQVDQGALFANVSAYWPMFGEWFASVGQTQSAAAKSAVLATIGVETAWTFTPLDEYGGYDYFERMYGPQTSVGQSLGNVYQGDGARYHGRGFIQLTGRSNYRTYGGLFGIDLEGDPDQAKDPYWASGAMVTYFQRRDLWTQANAGNWEQVRRGVNGGLNGYDAFIGVVNALAQVEGTDRQPPAGETIQQVLARVNEEGVKHLGDPYVWDGEEPGGFDCSGYVAYCYQTALGIKLPSFTDALYDATDRTTEPVAGDIVLYEYYDGYQPGVRFPHVGLVTSDAGVTLDARGGVGVGFHPHVNGAVLYYRRARGLGSVVAAPRPEAPQGVPDTEAEWREKFIVVVSEIGDRVADELEIERSKLDDYGPPPKRPKPIDKMTKADAIAYIRALEAWAKKV